MICEVIQAMKGEEIGQEKCRNMLYSVLLNRPLQDCLADIEARKGESDNRE